VGESSSNVSIMKEFFNSQSSAGDLTSVLSNTSLWFQIVVWAIMFIGAIGLGIWILRMGVDMLLIVTRGTKLGNNSTMQGLGTAAIGKENSYDSVLGYAKHNFLEIFLVILLLILLFSGMFFRLVSMAIDGLGTLANKLFGLDIGTKLSALDAESFVNNIPSQRSESLRHQYDEQLSGAREYANQLYDLAKGGSPSDDPNLQKAKSHYTQAMVKANILADEIESRGVVADFKLGEGYFQQHLRQDGDGVCNQEFILDDVVETFNVSGANANISCN